MQPSSTEKPELPESDRTPTAELKYPFTDRVKRALARRFPRGAIAFNWLRAKSTHRVIQFVQLFNFRRQKLSARWLVQELASGWRRRREKRLTVAVDIASFWEPLTGIGWYLYRLLEQLADRDDLRIRLYGPSCIASADLYPPVVALPSGPAIERILHEVPQDFILPQGWVIPALRKLEPALIAIERNDVLFAPNYFLPRRFDIARGARVATVHDLGLRRFSWTLRRETLTELNEKFEHAVFEATRLITVSRAVKNEMVAADLAEESRITPIHHGPGQLSNVNAGDVPHGTPSYYGLHVGTIEPRKNVDVLLEAWRVLARTIETPPVLVLCGKFGWKSEATQRSVRQASHEGWLRHLGYVSDESLAALYKGAQVVVFPTLYEGFGLPAVEALWAETPLVCSDLPVLREVTGGAAAFVPAEDPYQFAEAIAGVLADAALRERLIAAGRRRVGELSWRRASEQTASVWREAAGLAGSPR